ncbi:lysylphosphatidylglycerol synthase domain-containing protein [Flaviaesturariibacter amylovorans]|uniref:Flippase-like domain-containing protein n=1 Tax=Flaviaesturariibacter amylovorans TaxID=1084520 RepID=A0ABP8G614_9BACT
MLGPLLFAWLVYSIRGQVLRQPHLAASWKEISAAFTSGQALYLGAIILLMGVNWGLEAAKWRLLVAPVQPIGFWHALRAVLSGVSFSVTMPNRIGEYLGRMLYLPEGKRLRIIALTLVGSLAQLLITLWVGTASVLILKGRLISSGLVHPLAWQFGFFGLLAITLALTIFYCSVSVFERWLERITNRASWIYLVEALQEFGMQRLGRLLLLSGARYAVFVIQYVLAFHLFGVVVSLPVAAVVMGAVFLALAIIPSVVLLEVGIRGQVSLQLIGLFSANSLGILLSSVSIWFINLVVPALAGSLLILGIKIFKQRYEER